MSLASKITLAASIVTTTGIIAYVQIKQQDDIKRMHEGVIRDKERQQKRKLENTIMLEKQAQLTKMLKKQSTEDEAFDKIVANTKEVEN